jgi:hypothetical protein
VCYHKLIREELRLRRIASRSLVTSADVWRQGLLLTIVLHVLPLASTASMTMGISLTCVFSFRKAPSTLAA